MGVNSGPINYSISSSYSLQTNGSLGNSPTAAYGALNMSAAGGPAIQMPLHHNSIYSPTVCCLIDKGTKCNAPSGNASFSKKIERQVGMRKLKLVADPRSSHTYICEQHKQTISNMRATTKRKRKEHDEEHEPINDLASGSNSPPMDNGRASVGSLNLSLNHHHTAGGQHSSTVAPPPSTGYDFDLSGFQLQALRRYKKHFRVSVKPGLNKTQLAEELAKHFRTVQVNECDVLKTFLYTVKHNGNKLDFNPSNSKE